MQTSLLVAKPSGWQLSACRLGTWLGNFGLELGREASVDRVVWYDLVATRVAMERNKAAQTAREAGHTHILFIDPDIIPDAYVGPDPTAKPIWRTFWDFSLRNPGCVLCAPYCGCPPSEPVQIWSLNEDKHMRRVERKQSEALHGWYQIAGAGTGFMLIDTSVFKRLAKPYFHDTYSDGSESHLQVSQDLGFSQNCLAHGVPMYCNFDCWCDHQQMMIVKKPGAEKLVPPPAPELVVRGDGDLAWS